MPELDRKALKEAALKAKAAYEAYEADDSVENYNATEAADIALVEGLSFHEVILSLLASLEEAEGREEVLRNQLNGLLPSGDAARDACWDAGYEQGVKDVETRNDNIARLTARAEAAEQREGRLREIVAEFVAVYALHEDGDGNPCSIVTRGRAALSEEEA